MWMSALPKAVFSTPPPDADMMDNYKMGQICRHSRCAQKQRPDVHLHLITSQNRSIYLETPTQMQIKIRGALFTFPSTRTTNHEAWICQYAFVCHVQTSSTTPTPFLEYAIVKTWPWKTRNTLTVRDGATAWSVSFFLESRAQNET